MTVKLYIADISSLDIEKAMSAVSDERRGKARRLRSDENKRQSLGAALLLYRAVNGGMPFDCSVSPHGKPYCEGKAHFNLSHSKSMVVCAVSDCEVGVDIQAKTRDHLEIAKRFFTEAEYESILRSSDPDALFNKLWVMKESYIKAMGTGLSASLSGFEANEHIGEYSLRHIEYGEYDIAVCARTDRLGDIEIHEEIL